MVKFMIVKYWGMLRYDIPRFFRNIWLFRKNLWEYTWYNGAGSILPWVKTAVDDMSWRIEKHGMEVEESRMKKVAKMKRLSYLIGIYVNDAFIEEAEKELGVKMILHGLEFEPIEGKTDLYQIKDKDTPEEKEINLKIINKSHEIEKKYWEELCQIIKGPDYDMIRESNEDFDKLYDGSDIRAWWD